MLTILLVLAGLLLLLVLGLMAAGAMSYHRNFQCRFEGGGDYFPYFSGLHPDWTRTPVAFSSSRGDTLRGWVFSYPGPQKALIVLCHGYGMSLDDYLPECEYFCRRGYAVLAFDGSGTGASGGLLQGLPQHILDLGGCLDYVNSKPHLSALPLLLYGHSWGGYSADCVSLLGDYPIRGIVSASAFRVSTAALEDYMKRHWGRAVQLPLLGVRVYQRLKFGPMAVWTAVEGLKQVDAPVLILQSSDDRIIRFENNYGVLELAFREDPRKTFLPLTGKNHNITTPPEVDRRKRELLPALRSGRATEAELREMDQLKAQADEDLLERFVQFYDNCIG